MCFTSCSGSRDNCNDCDSLKAEIIEKFNIDNNSWDMELLEKVFFYIKLLTQRNPEISIRKNWDNYLKHLLETAKILFWISSNLTIEQVITALLHDAIEDVIEIDFEEMKDIFWKQIALSVKKLSKRYISKEWLSEEEYKKLKKERNIEFLEWLKYFSDFELDVKFADRIHNLRTLYNLERSFIERTIDETIKYYLPLARERNKKAYDLMYEEIIKLIKYLQKDELDNIFNNLETRIPLEETA